MSVTDIVVKMEYDINTTIVTLFLDLKRGQWKEHNRDSSSYIDNFKNLYTLKHPKVIFIDKEYYDEVISICKTKDPNLLYHKVISVTLEECTFYKNQDRMQEIMSTNKFESPECPEFSKPLYPIIMFEKINRMKQVAEENPYNSTFFMWMDFGFRSNDHFLRSEHLNKSIFTGVKYKKGMLRVVSFTKHLRLRCIPEYQKDEYYNTHREEFIIGTFFGGDKQSITSICSLHNSEVERILGEGYINSDQYLFTKVFFDNPHLFDVVYCTGWKDMLLHKFLQNRPQNIGFLIPGGIDYRGSSVSMFDYAYYAQKILGYRTFVITRPYFLTTNPQNVIAETYTKFDNNFKVILSADPLREIGLIVGLYDLDVIYTTGGGDTLDIPTRLPCLTVYNSVFNTNIQSTNYDRHCRISNALGSEEYPILPHIVDSAKFSPSAGDLRNHLNIPKDAIVFGRYGGIDSFDIDFVYSAIQDILQKGDDGDPICKRIWFLFASTYTFKHPRVIALSPFYDDNLKTAFIKTCDAMLHARTRGETFGLACAEFAMLDRPIITYKLSPERHHINVLGDKGIYYENKEQLVDILTTWNRSRTYNMKSLYKAYTPEKVIHIFDSIIYGYNHMTSRNDLVHLCNKYKGTYVEIGVWKGDFTEYVMKMCNFSKVIGIDPYRVFPQSKYNDAINSISQSELDTVYTSILDRFKQYKEFTLYRNTSDEIIDIVSDKSIDVVYIDGNHMYDAILSDLTLWYPKVSDGGIIIGDDCHDKLNGAYDKSNNQYINWGNNSWGYYGVSKAVVDFCTKNSIKYEFLPYKQFIIYK